MLAKLVRGFLRVMRWLGFVQQPKALVPDDWTPDWSIEKVPPLPLELVELDPTFSRDQGIDFERDIAWPLRMKDIN